MRSTDFALSVEKLTYPIDGTFKISRGSKTEAEVLVCTISADDAIGRGECVPYARYGETIESVLGKFTDLQGAKTIDALDNRAKKMSAGAARNALDCALWDWKAKRTGKKVQNLICAAPPRPLVTAFTLSLDTPENMANAARAASSRPLLKIKLGDENDLACMRAVAANAPNSKIIIDANEGWSEDDFSSLLQEAAKLNIALIEQPLPASADGLLAQTPHPVPICADESCHTSKDLEALKNRYDVVNIKLDKTGGLTEALATREKARALGFGIMVGCMVGSSLAMAPAILLAQDADFVDLDGPLLLAQDCDNPLQYKGSTVSPPSSALWG